MFENIGLDRSQTEKIMSLRHSCYMNSRHRHAVSCCWAGGCNHRTSKWVSNWEIRAWSELTVMPELTVSWNPMPFAFNLQFSPSCSVYYRLNSWFRIRQLCFMPHCVFVCLFACFLFFVCFFILLAQSTLQQIFPPFEVNKKQTLPMRGRS